MVLDILINVGIKKVIGRCKSKWDAAGKQVQFEGPGHLSLQRKCKINNHLTGIKQRRACLISSTNLNSILALYA
jgi:hypothetical protein